MIVVTNAFHTTGTEMFFHTTPDTEYDKKHGDAVVAGWSAQYTAPDGSDGIEDADPARRSYRFIFNEKDLGLAAWRDTLINDVGLNPNDADAYGEAVTEIIAKYGVLVPVPFTGADSADYGKGGNPIQAATVTQEVLDKVGDHALSYICDRCSVKVTLWMDGDWVEKYLESKQTA